MEKKKSIYFTLVAISVALSVVVSVCVSLVLYNMISGEITGMKKNGAQGKLGQNARSVHRAAEKS